MKQGGVSIADRNQTGDCTGCGPGVSDSGTSF